MTISLTVVSSNTAKAASIIICMLLSGCVTSPLVGNETPMPDCVILILGSGSDVCSSKGSGLTPTTKTNPPAISGAKVTHGPS